MLRRLGGKDAGAMVERYYFLLGLAAAGFGNIVRGCWA